MTQFMLRMNSSVSFQNVSRTDFPSGCNATSDAYYIEYSYNTTLLNVQVCMPDGASQSPWKATRDRQDTTETMFLDIHSNSLINQATFDNNIGNITFKLTVNTTLGYFELPNYNNSGIAGPLLAKDPICPGNPGQYQCLGGPPSKRSLQTNEPSSSFAIDNVPNLGPLAMMVAAMFEPGSYIATRIPNGTTPPEMLIAPTPPLPCKISPLTLLFNESSQNPQCDPEPFAADDGYVSITRWLTKFYDIGNMQNALHAAAILASQVWLNDVNGLAGELVVYYDLGQDPIRPKIPSAGKILQSILLAIDLLLLLAVATYISFSYTWAGAFDSSAMMRLGAARADELPLQVISSEGKENTKAMLKQMPGWVGDARPDDEVGAVAIGATVPLKAGRRYEAS